MEQKGLIRNLDKASRTIDFKGLKGPGGGKTKAYCSDIDGVMEFDNTYLIMFEIKEHGAKLEWGQKTMLERIADAWVESSPEKRAFVIHASHLSSLYGAIPAADCSVVKIYDAYEQEWLEYDESLLASVSRIGRENNIQKLK